MWEDMRGVIIDVFPSAPGRPKNQHAFMKAVNDAYINDAYHSLSIEDYRVTSDLIESVREGDWNPGDDAGDQKETRCVRRSCLRTYIPTWTAMARWSILDECHACIRRLPVDGRVSR